MSVRYGMFLRAFSSSGSIKIEVHRGGVEVIFLLLHYDIGNRMQWKIMLEQDVASSLIWLLSSIFYYVQGFFYAVVAVVWVIMFVQ